MFLLISSRFLIIQEIGYNNGRALFSMWSIPRYYKQGRRSIDNSVRESVKRGLDPGSR
jgi:hypothetical protein